MPQTQMHLSMENNRISMETETGFSLLRGKSELQTSRGNLQVLPDEHTRLGARIQLHFRQLNLNAIEFWQSATNLKSEPLDIQRITLFDGVLDLAGAGWRVAHSELLSVENYFDGYTSSTGGFFAAIPGISAQLGASENTPFPGLLFTHPERGSILMGVLSQEHSKPHWTLQHKNHSTQICAEDRFTGVKRMRVAEGRTWESEHWVVLFSPGNIDDVIDAYYHLIRKRFDFPGKNSILRRAVLWGTWNYNPRPRGYGDIDHDWIIANARALKKLVPDKPRFVMIDDGYQIGRSAWQTDASWFASCLEIFHKDGSTPHDPKIFPRGMKATADAIRRAGAQPAIWTTPRITRQCPLALAQPDWLLKVSNNRFFGQKSAFLDYSIPEVRQYTRHAWNTICNEWGYEGIKLDFWSMPFEIPEVRFANQEKTAVQLRNLFLQDVREFIPKNGYLMTCVVTNAGNPFIGRYADASRMGMDIGMGTWSNLRDSANSLTLSAPFYRHDALLGDADTIGWNANNSADENYLWSTVAAMMGSVCEIGGDLTKLTAQAKRQLQTATTFFKPAKRTRTHIADPGIHRLPASHLTLERPDGIYEAHLNWSSCNLKMDFPKPVRDIWTGRRLSGQSSIPPHAAVMFKASM